MDKKERNPNYTKIFLDNCKKLGLMFVYGENGFILQNHPVGFVFDLSASGSQCKTIMFNVAKQIFEKTKAETEMNVKNQMRNFLGLDNK